MMLFQIIKIVQLDVIHLVWNQVESQQTLP